MTAPHEPSDGDPIPPAVPIRVTVDACPRCGVTGPSVYTAARDKRLMCNCGHIDIVSQSTPPAVQGAADAILAAGLFLAGNDAAIPTPLLLPMREVVVPWAEEILREADQL